VFKLTISDLIENCESILNELSGYSGAPDVQSIKPRIKKLHTQLLALDKRIFKVLPYYSSSRVGLLGWSKHHLSNALLKIHLGQIYESRQQLISGVDSLRKLDTALKQALT
jgi:hypothetical protein